MDITKRTSQEQENVELVQQAYAAFGRGDIQFILNSLSPNIEWTFYGPKDLPTAGIFKGKEGVTQFFSHVGELLDFTAFEPREFIAQGDKVVALGYYSGKTKTTNRNYESHFAMVFTFQNNKIVNFREYTDTANLAAAFKSCC